MADLISIKDPRGRSFKLHRLDALPERPTREEIIRNLLAVGEIAALVSRPVKASPRWHKPWSPALRRAARSSGGPSCPAPQSISPLNVEAKRPVA